MISFADAKIAFELGGSAIALFDKLYPRIMRALTGHDPTGEPSIKIEKRDGSLVAEKNGKPHGQVTYEDLMNRLSPEDVSHIRMYEQSMTNYADTIEKAYPELALLPAIEKAQTEVRLKQMVRSMHQDLLGVLGFIETIGLDLEDHYSRMHDLIKKWINSNGFHGASPIPTSADARSARRVAVAPKHTSAARLQIGTPSHCAHRPDEQRAQAMIGDVFC
jgi:hypothetical protein